MSAPFPEYLYDPDPSPQERPVAWREPYATSTPRGGSEPGILLHWADSPEDGGHHKTGPFCWCDPEMEE